MDFSKSSDEATGAEIVPVIRSLWYCVDVGDGRNEVQLRLQLGAETLSARIVSIPPVCAWEVRLGACGVPQGGCEEMPWQARAKAEEAIMAHLRVSAKAWRKAA